MDIRCPPHTLQILFKCFIGGGGGKEGKSLLPKASQISLQGKSSKLYAWKLGEAHMYKVPTFVEAGPKTKKKIFFIKIK